MGIEAGYQLDRRSHGLDAAVAPDRHFYAAVSWAAFNALSCPPSAHFGEEDLSAERCVRLHDVHHALIRFLTAPILLQFVDEMLCSGWHRAARLKLDAMSAG